MKAAVISFLFCIGYLNVQCQAVQTWTRQQTIALMKAYGGSATSCHVTATNKDYDTCVVCTANEINVFAGTGSGAGRKWKQQSDSLKLDKNNFTDSLNNHPMFFSNANGSIGDSITWLKNDSTLIFRRIAVGSTGSSNDSVLFLQVPPIAVPTGHATINPSIGTLSTVIASDANIPIDQTMAPTWTGLHTFQNILSAASGSEYGLIISPSVNQTSTAGYTALLINPTQVTTGSGGKVLISTQVGGVEQFGVDNVGEIYTVSGIENESSNTYAKIAMPTTGMILSRSRADAVSAVTISNLNASSTGDILTLKNSGGTVVNVTKAGVLSATSPVFVTPSLGVATATSINGNTITTGTGVLTLAAAKTLTVSNTLTLAGTDATTMTFPTTSATIARTDAANTFTGHQTIEGVTSTGATGTANFVFSASPIITGTGSITATTFTGSIIKSLTNGAAANLNVASSDGATIGQTTAQLLFGGASAISYRISENGQTSTTLSTNDSYASHIIGSELFTESTGTHAFIANLVVNPLTGTNGAGTTTDAATVYINGAMTGITPTGRNDAFKVNGTSAFTGNMTFTGTNAGIFITTGSNARAGDATLVAGTLAITITGLTTSSRAQVTRTVAAGTTLTTGITAVCTANTLTITADVAAGTINTSDTSTYTYFIIN